MNRLITPISMVLLLIAGIAFPAEPLKVVTTTADVASLAREVGGDRVTVTSIARGYQDPHFVEPKPSFLMLLRDADLLAVIGLDLEIGWLPPLLDQSRNNRIRPGSRGYLDVSGGVEILDRPSVPVNRSMGDVHPLGNPHLPDSRRSPVRFSKSNAPSFSTIACTTTCRRLAFFPLSNVQVIIANIT